MALLKHGVKQAPGGKRKNSGRKPDWFKKKCQEIATSKKAIAFLQAVVEGDPIEEKQIYEGEEKVTILASASVDSRVRAWNSLMDRGFGKPSQAVEVSGEGGSVLEVIVREFVPKP